MGMAISCGLLSCTADNGEADSNAGSAALDDCRERDPATACPTGFTCQPGLGEVWRRALPSGGSSGSVSDAGGRTYCDDGSEMICDADDAGVDTSYCPQGAADWGVGGYGGYGGYGGSGEMPDPFVYAEWVDSRTFVLTIAEHADLGPYGFGLAETGNGGGDGWDGEDCIDGVGDGYDICHNVPAGGVLTLASIHPDQGGDIDQLFEGETTLMDGPRGPGLTYVLIRNSLDSNCWTWGHNPQHYMDELGCNNLL
jgi:hypothetical protein